jgi:hypothetical protein
MIADSKFCRSSSVNFSARHRLLNVGIWISVHITFGIVSPCNTLSISMRGGHA